MEGILIFSLISTSNSQKRLYFSISRIVIHLFSKPGPFESEKIRCLGKRPKPGHVITLDITYLA